jgi:hypothetical protein
MLLKCCLGERLGDFAQIEKCFLLKWASPGTVHSISSIEFFPAAFSAGQCRPQAARLAQACYSRFNADDL